MKKPILCFLVLLCLGALSGAGGKPISIMTYHYGTPGAAANMSKTIDNALGVMLDAALACAEVRSTDDIAAVLKNLHDQLLLGADVPDDRMTSLAGAMGANYLVATHVTMQGNNYVVTCSVIDVKTAQTVARKTDNLGSGDDALDAIEPFLQDVIDGLRNTPDLSDEKCPPPNEWIGTVTVHGQLDDTKEEPWGVAGIADEGKGKETQTFRTNYTAEVHITRTNQNTQVDMARTLRDEKVLDGRKRCWKSNNADDWTWKDIHHSILELIEYSANGASTEGWVGVSVADGKIKLSIVIPPIPGKVKHTSKVVYVGGCSPQEGEDVTKEDRWEGERENLEVEAPAAPEAYARSQSGSWTSPPNPMFPGAKTTVTWDLKWSKRSLNAHPFK